MKRAFRITAFLSAGALLLFALAWALDWLLQPPYPGTWMLAAQPEQTSVTPFSLNELPARYRKPNIVLILSDDQGWDDIGYNKTRVGRGHAHPVTPTLDEMAANGIVFDRFYAPASTCRASRAGYLTGREPGRYGMRYNHGAFPMSETTIAETLKAAGYLTGHFGKWHLGHVSREDQRKEHTSGLRRPFGIGYKPPYSPPWQNGFDTASSAYGNLPTFDPARRHAHSPLPQSVSDPHYYGLSFWDKPIDGHEGTRMALDQMQGSTAQIITDKALSFIAEAAQREQPFLAVIWFHTPHTPLRGDPQMLAGSNEAERRYLTSSFAILPLINFFVYRAFKKIERLIAPAHAQSSAPPLRFWDKLKVLFFLQRNFNLSLYAMDRQIDRLRQSLRAMGIADNTLIWFSSDNGAPEARGLHSALRGGKASVMEGGLRVPAILEWPGVIKERRVITQPVSGLDQYPTITDILGIRPDNQKPSDGVSLLPLIEGRDLARRQIPLPYDRGLIDGDYKLIIAANDGCKHRRLRLYDVSADLKEEHDLATALPAVRERMLERFNRRADRERAPRLCSAPIGGKMCASSCASLGARKE